jgi:hypothetical protein
MQIIRHAGTVTIVAASLALPAFDTHSAGSGA